MKLASRLLMLCIAITFIACSKKSNPDPSRQLILGKWKSMSYSVKIYHDGVLTFTVDNAYIQVPESKAFYSDGTGTITYPNGVPAPSNFIYDVTGNVLTVNAPNQVAGQTVAPAKSTIIEVSATKLELFSEYSETVDGKVGKTTTSEILGK
ncbi:MAG TPA: hypothetical protein VK668_17125 [Mucilaginibacter sp.]|nr:hypothetical protein [Mucilaginibacter sp.]